MDEDYEFYCKIFSNHSRPTYFIVEEVGGSVSLDDVVNAIVTTDDWEEFQRDIFYYDNLYHAYGPTTIVNRVLIDANPDDFNGNVNIFDVDYDGNVDSLNLDNYYPSKTEYEDGDKNIGDSHFFHYAHCYEKGDWNYFLFDINIDFNLKCLKPVFHKDSITGIISNYIYKNDDTDELIKIDGELIESRPSINKSARLFANTPNGLRRVWFDEIREDIQNRSININNKSDVKKYIIKKYNLKI
jgi:hypothetical protein|tara:strand:+ start:752 stop:1477 length:726 start_codon:yes stop_codon:yes gene_type:complete